MAKSHKTCMAQAETIDTFGTYQVLTVLRSSTTWILAMVWCVGRLLTLSSSLGITSGLAMIHPKRIYNFCLLHACFGCYCYVFATLSYLFITYFGTNLIMVARVHKFLFCTLCVGITWIKEKSQKGVL